MKFYSGDFYETWLMLGKILGHFTLRPEYVVLSPETLKPHKSCLFERNGIRLLG